MPVNHSIPNPSGASDTTWKATALDPWIDDVAGSIDTLEAGSGGGGMTNPMTTANDIIIGGASGAPTRLAKGANNTYLGVNGSGNLAYSTPAGGGGGGQTLYFTPEEFGAIGDGDIHLLSEVKADGTTPGYATVAAALVDFPDVPITSLNSTIDWAACYQCDVAARDARAAGARPVSVRWSGDYQSLDDTLFGGWDDYVVEGVSPDTTGFTNDLGAGHVGPGAGCGLNHKREGTDTLEEGNDNPALSHFMWRMFKSIVSGHKPYQPDGTGWYGIEPAYRSTLTIQLHTAAHQTSFAAGDVLYVFTGETLDLMPYNGTQIAELNVVAKKWTDGTNYFLDL